MKLAHSVTLSESVGGKYQTALELVVAERALGVDAAFVDPSKVDGAEPVGGVRVESVAWACDADLIVDHGTTVAFKNAGIPIMCVLHGQPLSNYLLETPTTGTYIKLIERSDVYAGFVTFWPEHVPYYAPIVGADRLHLVPAPVDLEAWSPEGPVYSWPKGKGGPINVVMADRPGPGKSLFHALSAFVVFLQQHTGAKLHVYGQKITKDTRLLPLIHLIGTMGGLGELGGWVSHGVLASIYRAADMVITETKVASRVVREALACGCQVVTGSGNGYGSLDVDVEDLEEYAAGMAAVAGEWHEDRELCIAGNRREAEHSFDPSNSAQAMLIAAGKAIASAKEPVNG